ncbi:MULTISPECIES: GerW family sporulation protein [Clostridium]|jgi:sporulation protein YtfJ|uniref:GerW family sporulation protein n=1 Tax=Clostridium TaxID=1485 RepID=UPI0002888698|nr:MULTISPECIES: GerW family sporulation protein [Clostridium]MDF2503819.1 sporulation protein YtfJ [Clostridium sp.]
MENHSIENLMTSTMENLRDMIDVNTIVGEPIESKDGTLILPISKVSFGFASGGSEFSKDVVKKESSDSFPFGGGSGAGVSVKPVAFLVLKDGAIRLLPVDAENTYDKMVDTIPQIIDLIKDSIGKHKENKNGTATVKTKDEHNKAEETNID